jgi:hypothetical protein
MIRETTSKHKSGIRKTNSKPKHIEEMPPMQPQIEKGEKQNHYSTTFSKCLQSCSEHGHSPSLSSKNIEAMERFLRMINKEMLKEKKKKQKKKKSSKQKTTRALSSHGEKK